MSAYKLERNTIAKDTSILVLGTIASQLILIAVSPFITRLYEPGEFGILAIYTSMLGAVGSVLSLRYDMAIVLPRSRRTANDLVNLSFLVTLITSFAALIFVYFLDDQIAKVFGQDEGGVIQWLLVASVLILGVHQIILFWAIRNKTYSAIAGSKLSHSIFMTGVHLIGFRFGSITLVVGQIVGRICAIAYLYYFTCLRKRLFFKKTKKGRMLATARQYRKFPIYTTWSALANSAGVQLPIMLFALFFSISAAGYYALAERILMLPMSVVGEAIQGVFFSSIAHEVREKRAGIIIGHFFGILARLAIPPMLLVLFFAPETFAFIFGVKWGYSGELAQWMAIWVFVQFCTGPLTLVFAAMKHNGLDFILQIVLFLVRMLAITLGVISESFYFTIALFAVSSSICYGAIFVMITRLAKIRIKEILRPLFRSLVFALMMISPLLYAKYFDSTAPTIGLACIVTASLLIIWYSKLWDAYKSIQLKAVPA